MEDKELLKLIDKYIDEALTVEETEEFNDLLECSKDFRDSFRKRIQLHGDLANHYDAANVPGITPFEKPEKRSGNFVVWALLTAVAAMLIFNLVLSNSPSGENQTMLAKISHNENAVLKNGGKNLEISEFLGLTGGRYTLTAGMIELEMPNDVSVAVEAPAEFTLVSETEMKLHKGKISGNVGEKGRGFEVITPQRKMIDLGTRFGVWVPSEGEEEFHVFEGEINVETKKERITVVEDQALRFNNSGNISKWMADQSIFPMPAYNIKAGIIDGSFENNIPLSFKWPSSPGYWGGDQSEIISKFENVSPKSGANMIRFIKPYLKGEEDNGQTSCQVWQIIDLREHSSHVNHGGVTANLKAFVNMVEEGGDNVDFIVSLLAFNGSFEEVKSYWDRKRQPLSELMSQNSSRLHSDNDVSTWQEINCQLNVPSGTDFILVQITTQDFSGKREFKGQFIDDVSVSFNVSPRKSSPVKTWNGQGSFSKAKNWRGAMRPDFNRDRINIEGGEAVIDSKIDIRQNLIVATNINSTGLLKIAKGGELNISRNGQFIVGFNPGASAYLSIEGILRTAGNSYIGRNNAVSSALIDGGYWDSPGRIRMAQYGKKFQDTQATLEIVNGGRLKAERLEMINDIATVKLIEGSVELKILQVGGDNGQALFQHGNGRLVAERLVFGTVESVYEFNDKNAELLISGQVKIEDLLGLENSKWLVFGRPAVKTDFNVTEFEYNKRIYTSFKLK